MRTHGRRFAVVLVSLALLAPAAAGASQAAAPAAMVTVRAGRVTVEAGGAPLAGLLAELARQGGLRIVGAAALPAAPVSVAFRDLPLEAALARLLVGYSYLVVVGTGAAELRIVAAGADRGTGGAVGPSLRGAAASATTEAARPPADLPVPRIVEAVSHPEQAVRLDAIARLAGLGSRAPIEALLQQGLGHPDPHTRLAVLSARLPVPPAILVEHALHDAAAVVRAEALAQLSLGEATAETVLRVALTDPDPGVQAVARTRLLDLDEARAAATGEDAQRPAGERQ
jgi:hypothetical protein